MRRALLAAIAAIHCILPVQGSPQLYGFTSSSATAPTQFVRMDASTGSITALWPLADFGPTASLEPYAAAVDEKRELVYGIVKHATTKGLRFLLVAQNLHTGLPQFNVSLPFGQYPGSAVLVGHSAGTDSGTQLDLDQGTGDVMLGGMVSNLTFWKPSTNCHPGCNASLCCVDPAVGSAACFDRITACADISEPAGPSIFRQYKMDFKTRQLHQFEQPNISWSKTGASRQYPFADFLFAFKCWLRCWWLSWLLLFRSSWMCTD